MAEAWQKREFEQQEFLNKIAQDAYYAAADDDHDTFFLALAAELARGLVARRTTARKVGTGDRLAQSYAGRFTRAITEFSRTPEEAAKLLGLLLIRFANSGLSEINAAYLHQTISEPQRLYDGHGSMDEVPIIAEK